MSEPITDEELAEWERRCQGKPVGETSHFAMFSAREVVRFIAALRAERAEVERLTAKLGHFEHAAQERLRLGSWKVDL